MSRVILSVFEADLSASLLKLQRILDFFIVKKFS